MKSPGILLAVLFMTAVHAHAHGATGRPAKSEWTQSPLLLPIPDAREDRMRLRFRAQGLEEGLMEVYGPRAGSTPALVAAKAGSYEIRPQDGKIGNYHWLQLREETSGQVRVASTVAYFSNPGPSPVRLMEMGKGELELVPEPLPREHGQYRESEKWNFRVRFLGQPLPGARVTLETAAGTRTALGSDASGRVRVLMPRDMVVAEGEAGRHGRRRSGQFVLSVEHEAGGVRYLTAFNGNYGPDPERSRNLAVGACCSLLGMVLASPLLRRRESRPVKGEEGSPHA